MIYHEVNMFMIIATSRSRQNITGIPEGLLLLHPSSHLSCPHRQPLCWLWTEGQRSSYRSFVNWLCISSGLLLFLIKKRFYIVLFYVWLLFLSMMYMRCIDALVNVSLYFIMEVFHYIFIHVTTDGYSWCFQFLAIINGGVINILAHVSWGQICMHFCWLCT